MRPFSPYKTTALFEVAIVMVFPENYLERDSVRSLRDGLFIFKTTDSDIDTAFSSYGYLILYCTTRFAAPVQRNETWLCDA